MTVLRIVKAVALAIILAVLLSIIGAILAENGRESILMTVFFIVGVIGFSIVLMKVQKVGFWFCLSFAIEWALLPISAAINTTQTKETGCAGVILTMGSFVFLAATVPAGAIGFILFLLLALLVFRKKKQSPSEQTPAPAAQQKIDTKT